MSRVKATIDQIQGLNTAISNKQDVLSSGTNIKTVNGTSILGSGDIVVSGGLTYLEELKNITSINTSIPVISLSPNASNTETNVDLVLNPKGIGSLSSQVADGTIANGNKRGGYSVDFQRVRTAVDQVCAGAYSFIVGSKNTIYNNNSYCFAAGELNTITYSGYASSYSFVFGKSNYCSSGPGVAFGFSNTVGFANGGDTGLTIALGNNNTVSVNNGTSGSSSAIGTNNTIRSNYSSAIGLANSLLGYYSYNNYTIGSGNSISADLFSTGNYNITMIGYSNSITSTRTGISNAILIGFYNEVKVSSKNLSSVAVGLGNTITADYTSLFGIRGHDKGVIGSIIFGGGANSVADGYIQQGKYILFKTTSAVSGTVSLATNNIALSTSNTPTLQDNEVRTFTGRIVAKDTGNTGVVAGWKVDGVIMRLANAGTTAFVGTPTITQLGATASATTNGYLIDLIANTTIGGLEVQFTQTGAIATKIVATIDMTESI